MSEALEEQQQIEDLLKIWRENRKWILNVILACALVYACVSYYKHHKQVKLSRASDEYVSLINAISQEDFDTAEAKSGVIVEKYSDTIYSALSRLALAKVAIDRDNLDLAKKQYELVIKEKPNTEIAALSRLRLAKLLFWAEENSDAALKVLSEYEDGFGGLFSELRGDIFLSLGKYEQAKLSYIDAHKNNGKEAGPFLRVKLMNLGYDFEEDKESE